MLDEWLMMVHDGYPTGSDSRKILEQFSGQQGVADDLQSATTELSMARGNAHGNAHDACVSGGCEQHIGHPGSLLTASCVYLSHVSIRQHWQRNGFVHAAMNEEVIRSFWFIFLTMQPCAAVVPSKVDLDFQHSEKK